MSYVVDKNCMVIKERETGVQIKLDVPLKDLYTVCRKLNLGSGFKGFTPLFMAEGWKDGYT